MNLGDRTVGSEYLRMEHISKHFGGIQALDDVFFSCHKGEAHVLIGENGAGKSTIIKILCGVVARDAGDILIDGKPVEINSALDADACGVAAVFQELSLIQELSVAENIFLGHEITGPLGRINFKAMYEEADRFLGEIGIQMNSRRLVKDLSLCQKQMVEIAKALYKRPDILLLDEATSALGEEEVEWLFEKIDQLTHKEDKTVIFISHRMDELSRVADRATIFRDAHYITSFTWGDLTNEEIVAYISGKQDSGADIMKNHPRSDKVVLEIRDGACGDLLHDINLKLREGEILGVAGLSGHGQVEMLHALFGAAPFDRGQVTVGGQPVRVRNVRQALKNGIVLVPEDRKHEGLLLERPIHENITLMALDKLQKMTVIRRKKEREALSDSVEKLKIKAKNLDLAASSLSGGNQQKLVIAKALLTDVRILLLSDPTRGIDIGTKNEIYKLMHDLAEQGMSIIFLSTELSELILLCDRVVVFYEGSIVAELQGEGVNEKNILAHAIGVAEDMALARSPHAAEKEAQSNEK